MNEILFTGVAPWFRTAAAALAVYPPIPVWLGHALTACVPCTSPPCLVSYPWYSFPELLSACAQPCTACAQPCPTLSPSAPPLPSALPLLCAAVQLGRMDEFASGAAPLIEHSLAILEADSAAVTDPDLNPDVLKAMLRRRHIMGRGGRKGEDTRGEGGRGGAGQGRQC